MAACALVACGKGKAQSDAKGDASALAGADAAPPPAPVTFTHKPPAANAKAEEKGATKMTLSMTVDPGTGKPQSQELENGEIEDKSEEVLAVSGDAVTKLQVTYAEKSTSSKENGKAKTTASALKGKTYVVEAKSDGKIDVRDARGHFVSSSETRQVAKDYHSLGKPDHVSAAMPARPLRQGDDVPELAKAIEEELADDATDLKVSDVSVKFHGSEGGEGVFEVTATLAKAEGPVKFAMRLGGTMKVRTSDAQLSGLDLSGPVTVGVNDDPAAKTPPKLKIDGKGSMEITETRIVP